MEGKKIRLSLFVIAWFAIPMVSHAGNYTLPVNGKPITALFDHTTPLFGGQQSEDRRKFTRYDGSQYIGNASDFDCVHAEGCYDGHNGVDFGASGGTNVLSAASGVVKYAYWQDDKNKTSGYGYYIRIYHSAINQTTLYGHLTADSLQPGIAVGSPVLQGITIAKSGNTGSSTGPHLHFSVFKGDAISSGSSIDPYGWSGPGADPWTIDQGYLWTTNPPSSSPLTSATAWDFTTSKDGWTSRNITDQGIYNPGSNGYWKFDPGIDPGLVSPQLGAVDAASLKVVKVRMATTGTSSDYAKLYFKKNINDAFAESNSVVLTPAVVRDGTQRVYYGQVWTNPNWTGNIAQVRLDPVANTPSDTVTSIYLDTISFEPIQNASSVNAQTNNITVNRGQTFSTYIELKNTGNTDWNTLYSLRLAPGISPNYSLNAPNPKYLTAAVAPNLTYRFNFTMTAPTTAGTYHTEWKMFDPTNGAFGAQAYFNVTVR